MRLLRLQTVLAATDLDPGSDAALQAGAALADATGAKLNVAHVTTVVDPDAAATTGSRSDIEAAVAAAVHRAGLAPDGVHIHVAPGEADEVISALSQLVDADVVIMGRHRQNARASSASSLGGTALGVLMSTPAPCLVAGRRMRLPIKHAVVAVDTSEAARGALVVALSWCSALRGREKNGSDPILTALHVTENTTADHGGLPRTIDQELEILRSSAGDWAGVMVRGVTERAADPAQAILKYATDHEADLIVLGTRGLNPDKTLRLGSVSGALTAQSEVPVLVVPPAVWRDYAQDVDLLTRATAPSA